MKSVFIALVGIVVVFCVGALFIYNGSPPSIDLRIDNQSQNSITAQVMLNDQLVLTEVDLPANGQEQYSISMTRIQEWLSQQDQSVGQLFLNYRSGLPQKKLELFGYIERGDNYLSGKQITVIHPKHGTPSVQVH